VKREETNFDKDIAKKHPMWPDFKKENWEVRV